MRHSKHAFDEQESGRNIHEDTTKTQFSTIWQRTAVLTVLALSACSSSDDGCHRNVAPTSEPDSEGEPLGYPAIVPGSVVFNTPSVTDGPGPATPGLAYEFRFDAVPGDKFGFVTMFVQSNDSLLNHRSFAREYLRKYVGIHIATAQDHSDTTSSHGITLL